MRALCGAIITAGALIALGLTGLGIGIRFQGQPYSADLVHDGHIGPWLGYIVVFLTILTIIGIGIAFLGLMYHHERRHREGLHGGHGALGAGTTSAAGLPR